MSGDSAKAQKEKSIRTSKTIWVQEAGVAGASDVEEETLAAPRTPLPRPRPLLRPPPRPLPPRTRGLVGSMLPGEVGEVGSLLAVAESDAAGAGAEVLVSAGVVVALGVDTFSEAAVSVDGAGLEILMSPTGGGFVFGATVADFLPESHSRFWTFCILR